MNILQQDYFTLFGLEPKLTIDLGQLKRSYFQLSREYHPDHQGEASSLAAGHINEGYKVLSDFDMRLHYLIKQVSPEFTVDGQSLPPMFLMEMMELNEAIEDATLPNQVQAVRDQIQQFEQSIDADLISISDKAALSDTEIETLQSSYLKRKYLNRLKTAIENK